ncbi:unnamed protein product [Polarella glacialis]|uniref:Integrase catalytic domain-containing protein n=1 Tax=Polarella glacialis TaxID=89957 RepID=A0A813J880_POLGL|nr:unnamed protein product [Polarella glacialis]
MADDGQGLSEPQKTQPAGERADPLAGDAKDPWRHQIAELVRLAVAELEKGKKKSFRPKGSLGTAKLEEFYGEKDKYKRWKKVTKAQQFIYQLADEEMSLLLYLACRKDARDTIDVMEVSEMTEKGGLAILWELLDDAFDKEEDEKLDEAEESYYTWRRTPGMTMDRFIQTLNRLKMEYLNQDPESVISAKAFAQRMLQRSGLPHQQRMTVLFNAGGSYEPKEIERVLRRMFNRIAEQDVKTGKTYGALKPPAPGGPPAKPTSTRFKARFRVKSAMMAEEVDNYDDGEEEEAEQQERDLEENSEDMSGAEDEDDPEFHGALQQAFAAGWQTARKATAGLRKGRQFSSSTSSKQAAVDDPRKKNSVCASCQGKGHWKGDPECPNVVSGKDSPHTPKPKAAHVTSYVGQATEEMYANEVMTATALSKGKIQVDPGPSVEREQDSGKFGDLATGMNLNKTSTASQCQSTTTASTVVVTANSGSVKHPPSAEKVMPSQLLQTSRSETTRCGRRINFVGVMTRTTANAKTTHAPGQAAGSDSMPSWYQDLVSSSDDEMSSKRHREAKGTSKSQSKEHQVKKLEREEEELQQKLKDLQKKKQEMRSSEKDVTERILGARRAKEKLKKPPHPGGDDGDSPDLSSSSGDEDDDKDKKLMKAILKAMKTQEKQKQKDRRASGKTPPASSGASSTEESMMEKLRRRFKDKMTFEDKEEPTEKEIDLDIRRGIYEEQFQDGIFRVHPKCAPRNDAQKQCKHKFHHLLWGANQAAWWARCGTCGAKHVAYQSKPAFVGMLRAGEGIYYMDTRPGEALGDSGCRVTVGGEVWHTKMQQAVTAAGGRWQEIEENEYFRFGAGPVVPSKKAIIYPVGFFGKQEVLRMSFVGGEAAECPGLVSPADMGRFKVGMDFGTQRLFVRGVAMPMEWTGSGHPRLYLLDYPGEGPKPLDEQGTMMAQLTHPAYHQFLDQLLEPLVIPAHLASAADEVSDGTSSGMPALTDSSDSEDEGPPPLVDESDSEEEPDGSEESTAGSAAGSPARTSARRLLGEAEDRPQGAGSEPEETLSYFSESSHEDGWISPDRLSEVESPSEEEAEPRTTVSETFFQKATDFNNGRQFINKGLRKKLRKNLDDIKEAMEEQQQSAQEEAKKNGQRIWERVDKDCTMAKTTLPQGPAWENVTRRMVIDTSNGRALLDENICHDAKAEAEWSFRVSTTPRTLRTLLFYKKPPEKRKLPARKPGPWRVMEVFTWLCAVSLAAVDRGWTMLEPVTHPGWDLMKTADQRAAFAWMQQGDPDFLMLSFYESLRGSADVDGPMQENSRQTRSHGRSRLSKEPSRAGNALTHACVWNKRRPDNGMLVKKATRVRGSWEICHRVNHQCPGNHFHSTVEGAMKWNGKSVAVSEWAGGYSTKFASALVEGAEEALLQAGFQPSPEAVQCNFQQAEAGLETFGYHNIYHEMIDDEMEEPSETIPEERFIGADDSEPELKEGTPEVKAKDQEKVEMIPQNIKQAVQKAHRGLGHPERTVMLRMMRLSGASQSAVSYAKVWTCPVCVAKQRPSKPQRASTTERPTAFNCKLHLDLKFIKDSKDQKYVALSVVDLATSWHIAVLIKTRQSGYVAQKFLKSWIMHYGVPQEIVHDQGGEFTGEFSQLLDDLAIPSKVTGSHAGFQLAVGERHEGILNNILMAIVYEHQVEGKPQMAMALAAAITAKNSLLKRHGYTPEQAVFGRSLNWAQDLVDEPEDCKASSFQDVGDVATTASMRRTACQAFFRHDLQGKMKRAMQRAPVQSSAAPLLPGTVVYYWLPAVGKGRMRPDPARWRGPATVIAVEDGKKCYISWRGRCLLVTREQLRLASQEEAQSWEWIAKDTAMTGENLKGEGESGHYEDLRADEGPPARQPEDQRGRKVIKPEKQKGKAVENLQKIKARFDKKKELLSVEDVPATLPEVGEAENRPLGEAEDRPHGAEGPDAAQEEPDEDALFWKEVNDCEDKYVSEEARRLEREILQRSLLDDVPQSVKRVLANRGAKQDDGDHSPEHKKVRVEDMPDIAMVCAVAGNSTQAWLSREELRQLRALLRIPGITAAKAHRSPRRKLQPAPKEEKSRMTIMMTKDSEDVQVLDQSPEQLRKDERTKMPFLWRGVTVFYTRATKRLEKTRSAYVQTPAGLLQVEMNAEERQVFKQTYAQWRQEVETNEVYLLSLKKNGKELDQNQFNETENKAFKESDAKEWEQWVKNNVMKILTSEEAKKVPKEKIFQLPLRMVRTNKAKLTDGVLADLVAKSRLVVPGHVDPEVGEFRTDAPTTHPVAVSLTATIAASLRWSAWTFDVQTAFPVYVRAPTDGLPKVKDERAIRPFELLQILKSAYGLSEAPRLWYLRARELMQQCGFVELACCKAMFILVDPRTSLVEVIVCLHVDDGFVVGRAGSTLFETAKANMNKVFNIKEWICLQEQETDYLGYKVRQDENFEIHMSMKNYILQVKPMEFDKEASKEAEREVTDSERHDLLSLVMRLAWPARHCMPQVLYGVSYAAQTVRRAVVRTIKEVNKLLEFARHEAEEGRAELHFKAIDLTCPRVITPFDASFANEDGGKSQAAYVTVVTDDRVLTQEAVGNLVEFGSNKIHRVVRSTMAAESAALSIALDKQLYVRMLLEALLYGERSFSPEWKEHMTIPGMVMAQTRTKEFCVAGNMVTDAKSLYDHLSKTGNLPSERQVMLDLLAAKELEEAGVTQIRWVPSVHQLADALTKSMVSKILVKFLDTNLYSLVQTGAEAADEEHRAELRRGQRKRRKERSKEAE